MGLGNLQRWRLHNNPGQRAPLILLLILYQSINRTSSIYYQCCSHSVDCSCSVILICIQMLQLLACIQMLQLAPPDDVYSPGWKFPSLSGSAHRTIVSVSDHFGDSLLNFLWCINIAVAVGEEPNGCFGYLFWSAVLP